MTRRCGQRPRGTWSVRRQAVLDAIRAAPAPLSRLALAEILGCSWRSVRRDTDWLERHGLLARTIDHAGYLAFLGV